MIAMGVREKNTLGSAIERMYVRWAIYGLAFGLLFPMIDNAAHLGGLAGGFIVGYITGTPRLVEDWRENLWRYLSYACIGLTVLSFIKMYLTFQAYSGQG